MSEPKEVPQELREWHPLPFYEKKMQIHSSQDVPFLEKIASLDDDENIKALIITRLKELKRG